METGPELKDGGYAMTVGEGGLICFNEEITVEGTTFKKGDELVKRNGWWCPVEIK